MEKRQPNLVFSDYELDSILGTISKQNQQISEISKSFSETASHGQELFNLHSFPNYQLGIIRTIFSVFKYFVKYFERQLTQFD